MVDQDIVRLNDTIESFKIAKLMVGCRLFTHTDDGAIYLKDVILREDCIKFIVSPNIKTGDIIALDAIYIPLKNYKAKLRIAKEFIGRSGKVDLFCLPKGAEVFSLNN